MPRPYNLRSHSHSPDYREVNTEEEEEEEEYDDEEETRFPGSQDHNTSYRSESSRHQDSSGLSTTGSESFSFHSGSSPTTKSSRERLYPDLSPLTHSPETKRRGRVHGRSPRSSPDRSPHRADVRLESSMYVKPEKSRQESQSLSFSGSVFAIVAVLFLLFCLVVNKFKSDLPPPQAELGGFDAFVNKVDLMKDSFPGQDSRFWRTIKSCARHVFDPEQATYPAVLLMVAQRKDTVFAASIGEAVGREFGSAFSPSQASDSHTPLNLTTSTRLSADEQKLHLDEWLKSKLDQGSVAVVNHLESLHPEAALLLHGYCDGDNAPYKSAMLIFGLYLDKPVTKAEEAEQALKKLWLTDLLEDKIGALLSRVANNIVLVNSPVKSET